MIGGIGLAECGILPDCCELQKLYLCDAAKGRGLGYEMVAFLEEQARRMGYRRVYLETHSVLRAAIRVYEKSGYAAIPRPASVIHGTMDRFYQKEL